MQNTSASSSIAILVDRRTGREFNVSRLATSIGRDSINDFVILDDKTISRHHATISYVDGKFFVLDCGSKNGTRLNGKKLDQQIELKSGDELSLGLSQLIFVLLPSRMLQPITDKNRTETLVKPSKNAIPALSY